MSTETFGDYGTVDADEPTGEYLPGQESATGKSLLDELVEDSKKDLDNIIHLPVPQREGYNLRFNAIISRADISRYEKAAKGKSKKAENMDTVLASAMPILEKCTGMFKGGTSETHRIPDTNGKPLKPNSNDFLAAQGYPKDAIKALQKWMGDAGITTIGAALLEAAGWTEELEPLDPTEGSEDG